jgi:hypothetical protein
MSMKARLLLILQGLAHQFEPAAIQIFNFIFGHSIWVATFYD